MSSTIRVPPWARHLVYRTECTRTTWKLRLALVLCALFVLWATWDALGRCIERSLICDLDRTSSDAMLIENLDPQYELFERAAALKTAGDRAHVLVLTTMDPNTGRPDVARRGFVDAMAAAAQLPAFDIIPAPDTEPISLNAAYKVRDVLEREHLHSVTVVTAMLRSRRTVLIYRAALEDTNIVVRCVPVPESYVPNRWTATWHGVQDVAMQWLKLQYYRLCVLPFVDRHRTAARLYSRYDGYGVIDPHRHSGGCLTSVRLDGSEKDHEGQ